MTFRSWKSHMTRLPYLDSYLTYPNAPFQSAPTPTTLQRHPDGIFTQLYFHEDQEHPNQNSDEEVVTFRSLRSHMTRLPYPDSLPYLPECNFLVRSNAHYPKNNPDGNLTQWAFHRVQEHPNRSSDEEVMTFQSWRSLMTKQSYPGSLPYFPERPFPVGSDIHYSSKAFV